MSETAIKVTNVSKIYKLYDTPAARLKDALGLSRKQGYREHAALHDITLEIKKGETVGIIGTNGSGKSTLLKIITGVISQSRGEVEVAGRISALLELGAGFNQEYTGIENVYLQGTMMGFTREEIQGKMEAILEFADIGDFVHQPVKTYSSGMFVRLAFAVAINIEPEILIVDEALSVGDVFFQSKCYRKFEEFKEMGKTILFVSHDLSSITKYCDRAILLNKGVKVMEGTPKEAVDRFKMALVAQEEEKRRENSSLWKPGASGDKWRNALSVNPETLEYGDKKAEITDFAVVDKTGKITNVIQKGEPFTIKMKVAFLEVVAEPIFAFTLKNLMGIELTGTNTMLEQQPVEPKQPGEEQIVSFTQRMTLQGGEYLLSLGCTGYEQEDFRVHHRLYDVCSIAVVSQKNTVGYFDMESAVELE
ncbi:MAG: ABC transporter ATP-binding protein [Lachnospiraceae bacterium]|jgi:ABC-type polysaccharide/polyol phosphate transport system ATPase subunit|nr:ABC transporter ATP-binding protein [Lachnospiraceae bacterium]MCI9058896.1 ABC transporter ATP-binding protein [Lachnospiraceae bacterium]